LRIGEVAIEASSPNSKHSIAHLDDVSAIRPEYIRSHSELNSAKTKGWEMRDGGRVASEIRFSGS
jgi:hypothetical protein